MKGGGEGKKGKGRGGKRMEGEEEGNGAPTYKGREVKGGGKKGEGGFPRLLRFPPGSMGARIVTGWGVISPAYPASDARVLDAIVIRNAA